MSLVQVHGPTNTNGWSSPALTVKEHQSVETQPLSVEFRSVSGTPLSNGDYDVFVLVMVHHGLLKFMRV